MSLSEYQVIYDAELVRIEPRVRALVFARSRDTYLVHCDQEPWWQVGDIGRLTLGRERREWNFRPYADQRLRREPALDDRSAGLWGWRIGDMHVCVKQGVLPGKEGTVIREDTEPVCLDLPREFLDLCQRYQLLPTSALRAFIADLCDLESLSSRPREDGYCSLGSHERLLAEVYFLRAHGWRKDDIRADST
jgi:hypothetical protein